MAPHSSTPAFRRRVEVLRRPCERPVLRVLTELSHDAHRAAGQDGRMTPTPRTKVLVVDDEPYLAELLGTALRYEGYETALAGSAAAALTQVARFRPDLVVLDVMLPDGS